MESTQAQDGVGARNLPGILLGHGREGIVTLADGMVIKRFHPGNISDQQVNWLQRTLRSVSPHLPEAEWYREDDAWCCRYPHVATAPAEMFEQAEVREFLLFCLSKGIVCANIKRANFRRRSDGLGLLFVDIGEGILPMNVDYFIDSAARLYAIGILGWSDDELRRRDRGPTTEATLASIPRFADFYRELLHEHVCLRVRP